jgi:Bacterial Ig-like domain (group 3)/FG-GAP-like repeat
MVATAITTGNSRTQEIHVRLASFGGLLKRLLEGTAIGLLLCVSTVPTLAQAPTDTTLAVTFNGNVVTEVAPGSAITLTTTVKSDGIPVTPGQVNFCDASVAWCTDIRRLGTAQLNSSGTATLKLVLGIGVHSIKAVFVGTNSDASSSSAASALTVTGTQLPWSASVPYNFVELPTDKAPQAEVIADFNGDGYPDIAVSIGDGSALSSPVDIFLSNGNGSFTQAPAIPTVTGNGTAGSIVAGDFKSNGIQDLAVVLPDADAIQIFLGNGDGTFTLGQNISASGQPLAVATGDFNGDGIADLAVAAGDSITIFLGNGDGTFTETTQAPTSITDATAIAVGDFNGDGKQDLAAVTDAGSDTPGSVTIFLGNGDATFTPVEQSLATAPDPASIVGADYLGKGNLDLAVACLGNSSFNGSTVNLFAGNGDGTFAAGTDNFVNNTPYESISFGDIQNDGDVDLSVTGTANADAMTYYGLENGTFNTGATSWGLGIGSGPIFVAEADFNGDGFDDLAMVLNTGNAVAVYTSNFYGTQTQVATTTTLIAHPDVLNVGQSSTLTATVMAANGTTPTGTVNFINGASSLGTATLNSSGVATLTLTPALGTYSITASYGGSSTYAASTSSPPVAVSVVIASTTTELAANALSLLVTKPLTLTATVQASSGPTPTGLVTFNNTNPKTGAVQPLDSAPLNASGVASVTLTPQVGDYVISASYAGSKSDATSISPQIEVAVNPAPTTTVLEATPSPASLGQMVSLTATVSSAIGAPTGTILFYNGNALLGTEAVANGQATVSTNSLPVGAYKFTAVYSGDDDFLTSTSATVDETITPPNFTISISPPTQTVYTGLAANYTVTFTQAANLTLPVALTCSQIPSYTTCAFSNGSPDTSETITLSVQTTAPTEVSSTTRARTATGLALAGLLLLITPRRRRSLRVFLPLIGLLALGIAVSACGAPITVVGGTPNGKQTVTVSATLTDGSQSFTQTANATLNVNPLF